MGPATKEKLRLECRRDNGPEAEEKLIYHLRDRDQVQWNTVLGTQCSIQQMCSALIHAGDNNVGW